MILQDFLTYVMDEQTISIFDFCGDVALLTVSGLTATEAKEYALNYYSNLITENNFIKAVKV